MHLSSQITGYRSVLSRGEVKTNDVDIVRKMIFRLQRCVVIRCLLCTACETTAAHVLHANTSYLRLSLLAALTSELQSKMQVAWEHCHALCMNGAQVTVRKH